MEPAATSNSGLRVVYTYEPPLTVDFGSSYPPMTEDEFLDFCMRNDEARIERDSSGEIIIMPPAFSETGAQNSELAFQFETWARTDGRGKTFDSSAGFTLPNGAVRSPDLSWIRHERWNALSEEARDGFAHICPDFVVELRSKTDRLSTLAAKMHEYAANGAELGWLIDPIEKKVYVYRPDREVEEIDNPSELSGEPLLAGFVLDLISIWE